MLARLAPRMRAAAAASAAAATAAALRVASLAEPAAAEEPPEKPKQCLQLNLLTTSTTTILECYPAQYSRVVADRVLIRPCMTELFDSVPLRPIAVVEDGSTQSVLIVPAVPLWTGPADLSGSSTDSVGYPVLPISISEVEIPTDHKPPPLPPPPPADEDTAAELPPPPPSPPPAAAAAAEPAADDAAEVPTLWEQVELPWMLLESAGVLVIERDANAMPCSARLATGGAAWMGELPAGGQNPGVRPLTVTVRLIDAAAAERLDLHAKTEVPECGFCRFMKNGPCGDVFVAWEACVDVCRDAGEDFVEKCGKATLALKACTDEHPEYYGEL